MLTESLHMQTSQNLGSARDVHMTSMCCTCDQQHLNKTAATTSTASSVSTEEPAAYRLLLECGILRGLWSALVPCQTYSVHTLGAFYKFEQFINNCAAHFINP